jgi:hypothetical protein
MIFQVRPNGIAGFAFVGGSSNATLMQLEGTGNLGLGVTPSAWGSNRVALQVGASGKFSEFIGSGNGVGFGHNYFFDGTDYKYINTDVASRFSFDYDATGGYAWLIAASGTAGNAISFTQAMTLAASGNLLLGTTGDSARLTVDSGLAGIMAVFNSTSANGGYITLNNSGSVFGDIGTAAQLISGGATSNFALNARGANALVFATNQIERARITAAGSVVAGGSVALGTTATDGFLYVPTCAGTPTGTPTAITGMAPIVVDTTNNKLYFYSSAQWRDAGP